MPQTVVRMYGSAETAQAAVKELRRQRFSTEDVFVVSPPAQGVSEDEIVAEIRAGGIPRHRAVKYAAGVQKGGTLVTVHAPFGSAALAGEVLDHFEPIDAGVSARDFHHGDFESDATPFSRMLGWQVLSHNPEPFSNALGWPTLTKTRASLSKKLGLPEVAGSAAPASKTLGLPVLSNKPAPFSGMLGLPTLSGKAAPFSAMLGLPTLTKKQTVLGDPAISSKAAPFSDALHLPVLTKDQR